MCNGIAEHDLTKKYFVKLEELEILDGKQ